MSFNYNRTVRSTSTYSTTDKSYFTSQASDAWAEVVDTTYDDQEAGFWSTDSDDSDDDMDCVFFSN